MIGNDFVDLRQAKKDSNWKREGYLNKIFGASEQKLINYASDQNELIWIFWSMKEAVYKIHNRKTGIRSFAPTKLVCSILSTAKDVFGTVLIDNVMYHTKTKVNGEYIHTISIDEESSFDHVKTTIYNLPHPLNYKQLRPACVSHHGKYLALVYI